MQNGGKCQISDICPRSAPCISGPVSSMLEEMRKGAEEDAGRVSRHALHFLLQCFFGQQIHLHVHDIYFSPHVNTSLSVRMFGFRYCMSSSVPSTISMDAPLLILSAV